MRIEKALTRRFYMIAVVLLYLAFLSACGRNRETDAEAERKNYGLDFMQSYAMPAPEQLLCGPECAWAITGAKGDPIYRLDYVPETADADRIEWKQAEGESLLGIAWRDGILYAEVYKEEDNMLEIRKYTGGIWLKTASLEAAVGDWQIVGGGLYVDGEENIYLVSQGKVTRFGADDLPDQEYSVGGKVCFFRENSQGGVECVTAAQDKIALYSLTGSEAEKRWELTIPAPRLAGIASFEDSILCLATEEELLFIESETGGLLARSSLLACGIASVRGGVFNPQTDSLRLYGTDGEGYLCCGLLSTRDAEQQRTELVYGTLGAYNGGEAHNVETAIMDFNRNNREYYITVRNYGNYGENGLQRLQADMAGGKEPDIIEMYSLGAYEPYVYNGYLEDLTPYLEQSPYRDDILWNVLDIYRSDGGLYLMMPHFSLEALVIHPEYQGEIREWNMEAFMGLVEKNQWQRFLLGGNDDAEILLWYMLSGKQSEFIDWERREADFVSEGFVELLALCRENGERQWPDTSGWTFEEMQENAICGVTFFPDFSSYLTLAGAYGREYPLYGYPTATEQEYRVGLRNDSCAIYAGSRHKEGAWAYVESLLEEKYQLGAQGCIPIRASALEKYGEEQKKTEWKTGDEIISLTDAEVDIIKEILYRGNMARGYLDTNILNIVQEEAAAYFAGDKSAEETAGVIQSRVLIYLNE